MPINYRKIFVYGFFTIGISCSAISHHLILLAQFFLSENIGNYIFYLVWVILAFVTYKEWKRCIVKSIFYHWIIWTIFIMASILLCYKEQMTYFSIGMKSILWFLPLVTFGFFIKKYMYVISDIIYLLPTLFNLIVFGCFALGISGVTEAASQDFGYDALAGSLLALGLLYKKFSVIQFCNVIISCYCIILCGERGPLVSFIIVFIMFIIRKIIKDMKAMIWGSFFVLLGVFFLITQYEAILSLIAQHILTLGTSTHTLKWLIESSGGFEGESRLNIYLSGIKYLTDHVVLGSGAFCDRIYLHDAIKQFTQSTVGSYPHNIFLEWCMQWGAVIGLMIGMYFIYIIYKNYIQCDDEIKITTLMFLIGVGFLPLLVSRSYIEHRMFWVLFGYLLSYKVCCKNELKF